MQNYQDMIVCIVFIPHYDFNLPFNFEFVSGLTITNALRCLDINGCNWLRYH